MTPAAKLLLYWTPRIVAILFALFLASCEVFDKVTPIPPEKASFVGLWTTGSGFKMHIKSAGTADITQIEDKANPDYEKLNLVVAPSLIKDIRVYFKENNTLEVIKPTLYAKEYHIDSYPSSDSVCTTMVLNGVRFSKEYMREGEFGV